MKPVVSEFSHTLYLVVVLTCCPRIGSFYRVSCSVCTIGARDRSSAIRNSQSEIPLSTDLAPRCFYIGSVIERRIPFTSTLRSKIENVINRTQEIEATFFYVVGH